MSQCILVPIESTENTFNTTEICTSHQDLRVRRGPTMHNTAPPNRFKQSGTIIRNSRQQNTDIKQIRRLENENQLPSFFFVLFKNTWASWPTISKAPTPAGPSTMFSTWTASFVTSAAGSSHKIQLSFCWCFWFVPIVLMANLSKAIFRQALGIVWNASLHATLKSSFQKGTKNKETKALTMEQENRILAS